MATKVIMLLTNTFRPDPRVHKEAKALIGDGYEVTLFAWDREGKRPQNENIDGIEIRRIRTIKPGCSACVVLGMLIFWAKSILLSRKVAFDAVHAHDFDTLLPAILIAWLRRVPVIYDAHEHYSRMVAVDVPSVMVRLIDRLELASVALSDLVIIANPPMAPRFTALQGPEVVIVANCVDLPDLTKVRAHSRHREVVLFYGGTLEPMRYIEETIAVVKGATDAKVVFVGAGRLGELAAREASKSPNVEFLGFMDWNSLMQKMVESDAVLCLLDPRNENYRIAIANRLCEGMAFGVPVLASKGTLCGDIVEKEGAGIVIEWSPENLVRAIEELREPKRAEEMGIRGRAAAEREYNWKIQKTRLLESYREVLRKG